MQYWQILHSFLTFCFYFVTKWLTRKLSYCTRYFVIMFLAEDPQPARSQTKRITVLRTLVHFLRELLASPFICHWSDNSSLKKYIRRCLISIFNIDLNTLRIVFRHNYKWQTRLSVPDRKTLFNRKDEWFS